MSIKRAIAVLLCAAMLLAAVPCALGEADEGTRWLRLGTSALVVQIDDGFMYGEMSEEDIADDQVAYLYSEETALDFDVYQFSKEDEPEALADYAEKEAAEYNGVSELVTDGAINDIPVASYRAVEEYEEAEYNTITYIMEDDGEYVEIVFWLDGEDAEDQAAAIIGTLKLQPDAEIRLGTSPLSISALASYEQGYVSDEDIANGQVAYWYSPESTLDFDVYQFSKDGLPQSLAEYAEQEAEQYNGVSELVTDEEINGVPASWYRTIEEYEEAEYETITYILDAGDDYVEIVFWLDGMLDDPEADEIIHSLKLSEA